MKAEAPIVEPPVSSMEPPRLPEPHSVGGEIRRGLYLASIITVVILTFFYWQGQSFWIPDILAVIPYISLPILSVAMLFYPGHRLLGLIGFITSGAILYIFINHVAFISSC